MGRTSVIAVVMVVGLLGLARRGEPCSCGARGPACEAVWDADAVFMARVVRAAGEIVRRPQGQIPNVQVRVQIVEPYRGVPTRPYSHVDVFTPEGGTACGVFFTEGDTYLIYASRDRDGNLLTTSCSSTRRLTDVEQNGARAPLEIDIREDDDDDGVDDGQNELAYLRSLAANPPRSGRVFGRLLHFDGPRYSVETVAGRPVVLTGGGRTWRTIVNDKGHYEFGGLEPGTYQVDLELPDTLYANDVPRKAAISAVGACDAANFYIGYNGRLRGRIVDARGAPLAGLGVDVAIPKNIDAPWRLGKHHAVTDADGSYTVSHLAAERYVAQVTVKADPESRRDVDRRLLYPGVTDVTAATVFTVGPAEQVKADEWRMPAGLSFVKVIGTVVDASGRPAAGVSVVLYYDTDRELSSAGVSIVTGATGRFTLSALAGHRYRVHAVRHSDPFEGQWLTTESAVSAPFTAVSAPPSISLRLVKETRRD